MEEYKVLLENSRLKAFGTSDIEFWESQYRIPFRNDFKAIVAAPHNFGFRSCYSKEADETDNFIHILHDMQDNCNGFFDYLFSDLINPFVHNEYGVFKFVKCLLSSHKHKKVIFRKYVLLHLAENEY